MLRVGLTGGIASGKSVVSTQLEQLGAHVIDADVLAREVVEPGTSGLAAIRERFGAGVLTPAGALDRAALGRIVFSDPTARADLNAIVHPAVRARAAELERAAGPDAIVVHVIPLLVETGQADDYDLVVVVDIDPEIQLARLVLRDGFSPADARARIAAQATRAERLAAADIVLSNQGDLDDLRRQVKDLWSRLEATGATEIGG